VATKIADLGNGLELWKAAPSEIREQDVNARSMNTEMFRRLTMTIERDQRLESFPLCVLVEEHLEVISGHHRLRASIAANLPEIIIIVDVTGLTRDQIKAKQLAHNAISGEDNQQLLNQIFNSISDAEARLEAFTEIKLDKLPSIKIHDIALDLDYKAVLMLFLPSAKEQFERILNDLTGDPESVYVCDRERFEQFKAAATRINKEFDIRSAGTVLAKMCEIVDTQLGHEPNYSESVALRDLFKASFIPNHVADRLKRALEQMKRNKQLPGGSLWMALDRWAAEELGEENSATETTTDSGTTGTS